MVASTDQFSSVFSEIQSRPTTSYFLDLERLRMWRAETTFGGGLGPPKFLVRGPIQFAFTRQQLGEPSLNIMGPHA